MKFGTCMDCGEYKFLDGESACPTCTQDDGGSETKKSSSDTWAVVSGRGYAPYVIANELSKSEAEERASKKTHLKAVNLKGGN